MLETLRVLLVEDFETDAKLVVRELMRTARSVEHHRVQTPQELREALARGGWDIVLSDWSLPTFSALEALRMATELAPDLPFVIVSGTVGEELAADAMRAGASDYVIKDRLARLGPVVRREVRERRKRDDAHRSLLAAEQRYRCIVENTQQGVLVVDTQARIVFSNARLSAMIGYETDEIVGASPLRFVAEGHREESARSMANHGPVLLETRLQRKDGSLLWVLLEGTPIFGPGGVYEGAIAMCTDLTERKTAETALQSLQAQLLSAQKMEAIGRLAGGVAHDMNNMLAVIVSYTELLSDSLAQGDPRRDDVVDIRSAADRGVALVRQLLAFSRQQVLRPVVVDLNVVVEGVLKMLRTLIGEDIDVRVQLAAGPLHVKADPGQIEQVLVNLAVNARDAMPQGGTLTIATEAAHGHAILRVDDDGTGMATETRERLFEPFFTTKEAGKGTGLGLATVFGIVSQSSGHITVDTELGRGTSFEIELPLAGATRESSPASRRSSGLPSGNETILLLEDSRPLRAALARTLRGRGYRVLEAGDAREALQQCDGHEGTLHLVLSDVVLPGPSGPVAVEQIRERYPFVKVLFMSGYTDLSDHPVLADVGTAFLQKPFEPAALARSVRSILDA